MSEKNPPWALENLATHHADVSRSMLALLNGGAEGILASSGLGTYAVTQRGAGANMSVDVGPGVCVVTGDENNVQGLYGCVNDATVNLVIAAADPTNPRRDLIVARVQDAVYSGATNAWSLAVVQGTAAASPADPTVPNNALVLARVAVAAAVGSITNANITDLRAYAPLGVIPGNSARRPGIQFGAFSQEPAFKTLPVAGQRFYELDTSLEYVYNGSAWVCVTPQSATVATSQTTTSTAYTNLTTTGPAVTVQTGTKALITLSAAGAGSVIVADSWHMGVAVSGATTLAASDANSLRSDQNTTIPMARTFLLTGLTPGANVFTTKYRVASGTGTFLNRDITVVGIP